MREERGGGVRNANMNDRSRGRSLLHGQDVGKTHDHGNSVEQWLAGGGGWWRLVAVGGGWWRLVAVGRPWGLSLRAVLNKKKLGGCAQGQP